MTFPTTVPEVLLRAVDIVTERGLAKGQFLNAGGQCCAVGAVYLAAGITPGVPESSQLLWDGYTRERGVLAIHAVTAVEYRLKAATGLPVWNDKPERTVAEVAEAFRRAAADWAEIEAAVRW